MKQYTVTLILALLTTLAAQSQGIQTLTVSGIASSTNVISSSLLTVPSNSYAVLKSGYPTPVVNLVANIQGVSFTWSLGTALANPVVFAGPATIQLQSSTNNSGTSASAFATFDIEPGPYPPGKAVTIGAYSGNVQVTMETSTDLVNWTTAVNAAIYTNSPVAQFFRITLAKNASP